MGRTTFISAMVASALVLPVTSAAASNTKIDAFLGLCKAEVRGDVKDTLGLRNLKIDPAGFCVCVALSLDRMISVEELRALVGQPLTKEFLRKYAASQGLCRVLIAGAALD